MADPSPHGGAPLTLRCWGARGSIPTPGPATTRYGGNTSCVELHAGESRLIFDAGSGLRRLGEAIVAEGRGAPITIFLSHFHWDHIQGFPFFAPLYDPAFTLHIVAPTQEEADIATLFAGQMGPVYFPIPFGAVAASTSFTSLNEGEWEDGLVRVRPFRMRHPSYTVGYRAEAGGCSVAYLPDNELGEGGSYPMDGTDWEARLRSFLEGTDLLLHDAMYTDEEYTRRGGWGHSTPRQALELALEAGVRRLILFHHAPERSDDQLDRILDELRNEAARRGGPEVDAAWEGGEWTVTHPPIPVPAP